MKRSFAILFLSIFLFNTAGYFLTYALRSLEVRSEIKCRIKQGVPKEDLVIITIEQHQKGEIIWKEEGSEFIYRGKMYDVVRQNSEGSSILYECISDSQEDQLFASLDRQVLRELHSGSSDKSSEKKSATPSLRLFYSNQAAFSISPAECSLFLFANIFQGTFPDSVTPEHCGPPPRLFFS
jgi:hypothetical protein